MPYSSMKVVRVLLCALLHRVDSVTPQSLNLITQLWTTGFGKPLDDMPDVQGTIFIPPFIIKWCFRLLKIAVFVIIFHQNCFIYYKHPFCHVLSCHHVINRPLAMPTAK